ncbi:hypothetical protein [Chamaesiphon sp. VAR_48_metabat_403]|uniref:hypothetical protein n=1 Tax=Chamaesiphon sp. VAR_48_metabat_403 TaxID=2964700 RepID=UPI00286D6F08|nr:hypothetical protein [Chamaesiphon sp. VAR_48_metabat_403]
MPQATRSNQDLYLCEEIQNPDRCSFPDCNDDIIPAPSGIDRHCFKHQIDPDL